MDWIKCFYLEYIKNVYSRQPTEKCARGNLNDKKKNYIKRGSVSFISEMPANPQ